jgi:hypothetical protein
MSTAIDTEPNYEGVAKLQIARHALNEREDDAVQACDLAMSKVQEGHALHIAKVDFIASQQKTLEQAQHRFASDPSKKNLDKFKKSATRYLPSKRLPPALKENPPKPTPPMCCSTPISSKS